MFASTSNGPQTLAQGELNRWRARPQHAELLLLRARARRYTDRARPSATCGAMNPRAQARSARPPERPNRRHLRHRIAGAGLGACCEARRAATCTPGPRENIRSAGKARGSDRSQSGARGGNGVGGQLQPGRPSGRSGGAAPFGTRETVGVPLWRARSHAHNTSARFVAALGGTSGPSLTPRKHFSTRRASKPTVRAAGNEGGQRINLVRTR